MSARSAITAAIMASIMENVPVFATGVYITQDGFRYGFRTDRNNAPLNFIFFDAPPPPPPPPSYNERIRSERNTKSGRVFLEMNSRQAHVLYRLSDHIGGPPVGPRSVFNRIQAALMGAIDNADNDGDLIFYGEANTLYISDES